VKSERLEFLADNPPTPSGLHFTSAAAAAARRSATELKLDWHAVKELDKQYMRAQLEKAGTPAPMAIGIDEISVGDGHDYRVVVSDLVRGCAIWFGGTDHSEPACPSFINGLANRNATGAKVVAAVRL
jgi:transposase